MIVFLIIEYKNDCILGKHLLFLFSGNLLFLRLVAGCMVMLSPWQFCLVEEVMVPRREIRLY